MIIFQDIVQVPTPDMLFWYSLSIILAGALIWVVNRYVTRTDKMFSQLIEAVNELRIIIKVHETEIENLKDKVFGKKGRSQ